MRIAFVGDIVGKPGREMIKAHVKNLKKEFGIDFVIVNGENVSHGFGLTIKNADEILGCDIDFITGGNHIFDKAEIMQIMDRLPIVRPLNYSDDVAGVGCKIVEINEEKLAIINLMGSYSMPICDNPFTKIKKQIEILEEERIKNIFIDFHAETTAEKRTLLALLRGRVSAICGTHTHVGTDDLVIENNTFYVTDIGLTGCMNEVIGMRENASLIRVLEHTHKSFDIPKQCAKIFQTVVMEIEDGKCTDAFKVKAYDSGKLHKTLSSVVLSKNKFL